MPAACTRTRSCVPCVPCVRACVRNRSCITDEGPVSAYLSAGTRTTVRLSYRMRNWICYLVRSECSGHLDATGEMSQVVDGLHGAFDADKRGRIAIHDTAQTVTQVCMAQCPASWTLLRRCVSEA